MNPMKDNCHKENSTLSKAELKAQKKMEKLAKLAKKQLNLQTAKPKLKTPKKTSGYNSLEVEEKWAKFWRENDCYKCKEINEGNNFCIVIPPPNITGSLHIGHAMMIAIEDCLVRYQRLMGKNVLFLPGLDHAGIATQSVVMNNLRKSNPATKITREIFMEAAHSWADKYGNRIIDQFNRMGTSLDYSKQRFTLDNKVSTSVTEAFVSLYEKGLIYRDTKIVNWSGRLQTVLSDLEVNYKEIKGGEVVSVDGQSVAMGIMYYIKYFLVHRCMVNAHKERIDYLRKMHKSCKNKVNYALNDVITKEIYQDLPWVMVGTTRPETILGDTGICINPNDSRFSGAETLEALAERLKDKEFTTQSKVKDVSEVSKYKVDKNLKDSPLDTSPFYAINPVTYEIIPVIVDEHADLSLGTGVLKITPSHDPVDYKLGKKHNLEFKCIMDESNRMVNSGEYDGLGRFQCRKLLQSHPCVVKTEKHNQVLPFCSRSNDIVEPSVKEQWWLSCKGMAQKAIEAVKTGEIKIVPEEAVDVWNRWLENIRDWCLSRQLWWGHRIPAYSYTAEGLEKKQWVVARSIEEAKDKLKGIKFSNLKQDEDVLDTWFSSGLWPFSTLGWKWDEKGLLKDFFPNSILETGSDILFFWVARMVMLSYELLNTKPFNTILLHGLVRDAHGRKMSKSLGNVIDPVSVIEGITQQDLIKNISVNVSQTEMERAKKSIALDYPQGIPKCGADALRFTLLSYTSGMKDVNLDILRVAGYSRLCNKIYNAFRFVQIAAGSSLPSLLQEEISTGALSMHASFMLNKLNLCIKDQHTFFSAYNFQGATQSIHMTFLYDFCDVYIELCKGEVEKSDLHVLVYAFVSLLKIFHPMMPFVTQEIFFLLFKANVLISDYPQVIEGDFSNCFDDILCIAKIIRNNKKVEVSKHKAYLDKLVKNSEVILNDKLDKEESIDKVGEIYYKIIE